MKNTNLYETFLTHHAVSPGNIFRLLINTGGCKRIIVSFHIFELGLELGFDNKM